MTTLRILADDLTGALDSAAAFAGEVPVHLDAPPADDSEPVSVVATATRDVDPGTLPALLAPSLDWLRGADLAFKKVDSLLRGNTFAEVAWLAAQGGFSRVVFAPAFPQQGRLTIDGRLQVGASAGERPVADGLCAPGMPPTWVPDVRSDDDLDRVASGSLGGEARDWLWCGSAGLGRALARAHGLSAARAEPLQPAPPPLLLVSASHHAVVRRQWSALRQAWPEALLAPHGDAQAFERVLAAMARPFDRALFDLAPAEPLSAVDAADLLARQVESIAARAQRPATLVVIGGDTLRALCRATGAQALRARASARVGWGCARLVGGRWDGVQCHSRSGAFGADDDLVSIVRALAPG